MNPIKQIKASLSFIEKYRFRWVLFIAVIWTLIDVAYWIRYMNMPATMRDDTTFEFISTKAVILRAVIVFCMSSVMSYLLIFSLREMFRNLPLLLNLFIKTAVLLSASLVMNLLLHITYSIFILNISFIGGLQRFFGDAQSVSWLFQHSVGWIMLFLCTQITIEINEKYAPGVFWDILIGKYIQPKVEKRIVVFIDLQDSTPIAEKLGSKANFKFIRDFIYFVSVALLESNGRIYQYVGDEIVVSWRYTPENVHKSLDALTLSSRLLKRNARYFKLRYGFEPEFKAGMHAGEVTVGEIGIIKKDIAMSGDIMNTAARIRSVCNELNQKCICSKDFLNGLDLAWKTESLGEVDLKGKSAAIELFAVKL